MQLLIFTFNQEALGDRETENNLLRLSIAGKAAFDKSYLQGLSQMFDAFQGEGYLAGIMGSTANNLIPLSSLNRNDIGKLFEPYMLEHNKGVSLILFVIVTVLVNLVLTLRCLLNTTSLRLNRFATVNGQPQFV